MYLQGQCKCKCIVKFTLQSEFPCAATHGRLLEGGAKCVCECVRGRWRPRAPRHYEHRDRLFAGRAARTHAATHVVHTLSARTRTFTSAYTRHLYASLRARSCAYRAPGSLHQQVWILCLSIINLKALFPQGAYSDVFPKIWIFYAIIHHVVHLVYDYSMIHLVRRPRNGSCFIHYANEWCSV